MNLYLRINYLIIFVFTLFFFSCNNNKTENNAQSQTLYNVVFRDTTMYVDGSVKALVAQHIPNGVTVTYSNNSLDKEGKTEARATFTLQNAENWWSFGDIKEYYKLSVLDIKKLYRDEDSINVRIDPRWRSPITITAVLTVVKGASNTTDPKFFDVVTKTLTNGKTELEIASYTGSEKDIVIPAYINNKAIRRIGENAFRNSTITSIVFPESDSLHYISKNAFRGCASLTKISLCKSIDSIADFAFMGIATDSITLWKNVKYLGEDAFGQTKLKRVRIHADTPPATKEFPAGEIPAEPAKEGYIFTGSDMLKEIFIPAGTKDKYKHKQALGWNEEFEAALKEM